ncbi:DNA-binding response regulator [Arcobacter cloacae]|uniref:DNA-binding response regulator n=3 Tax=Arcobacteraceae TaxID=2808963 RepID=A0A4Q0UWW7_9BACT|nr:response regulator transcription factor [Arcobacter sp.]QKE26272.1 two-component system response regulator, LytR/AlgR family [Arcobacter aquimarinus]QKF89993.1 two-component system response regulator, LytR/AlgR family [Arcobacter cloacae]RXI35729.1 DNA-binding response regulator [Arcobacter aquimarinus]RXI37207.1 DNA-binding response regulator [Arcobacter cloacae]
MKIMIVDDESLALSRLKRLLNENGIEDITAFDNPIDALKEITKTKFDAVFLDISMPNITGLELADSIIQLEPKTFIIFQTAYSEFALEAYKSGGMGYLVKPIESNDIKNILEKVRNFKTTSNEESKKILGKRGDKLYLIDINDIYYIKADLDEVIIKIKEADAYVRRKIGDLETLLSGKNFFRIHRSYIVNVDKIKSMRSVEQSKLEISFDGIAEIITSSKEGAKDFREYIERRSL